MTQSLCKKPGSSIKVKTVKEHHSPEGGQTIAFIPKSDTLESTEIFIILIVAIVFGFISLYFALRNMMAQSQSEVDLESVVNKVFGMT